MSSGNGGTIAPSNKYQFADVGLRVKGEWVKGRLSLERTGASAPFSLGFQPNDVAQEEHGLSLSQLELLSVNHGANNEGEQFLKLSLPGKREGKTKDVLFNFGNRLAAVATVQAALTSAVANSSSPVPGQASSSSASSSASSQEGGNSGYFAKYRASETASAATADSLSVGGASALERDARKTLLQLDDELFELYRAVVLSGLLGEEEFWAAREGQVAEERAQLRQGRGLSSGLTADVHAVKTSQDNIHFELSAEQMNRIFLDHPRVQRLHQERVGSGEMAEVEFWKLYLSSKYFNAGRVTTAEFRASANALEAAAVFGDYGEDEEEDLSGRVASLYQRGSRAKGVHVDPAVDLLTSLNDDPHGSATALAGVGMAARASFGIVERDPGEAVKDKAIREKIVRLGRKLTIEDVHKMDSRPAEGEAGPLLSSFNRHALLVLPDEVGPQMARRHEKRIKRAEEHEREAEVLQDLGEDLGGKARPVSGIVPLELKGQSAYLAVGGAPGAATPSPAATPAPAHASSAPPLPRTPAPGSLAHWAPSKLHRTMPAAAVALRVLTGLANDAAVLGGGGGSSSGGAAAAATRMPDRVEEIADHQELLMLFRASNELRKHFWTLFPPPIRVKEPLETQSAWLRAEDLAAKLHNCLERMDEFRAYALSQGNQPLAYLVLDLKEQLDKAVRDWAKFKEIQLKKRAK
jgi:hypothetical protein